MHIIKKLFDWPRLLCCFCWLGWCISWAEHVHGTLKVSQRFTPNFPIFLFCLSFGSSSRHHDGCNIYLKIWVSHWTAGFEMSCHDKTCGQFSDPCFCIKNVSVCEYCSQTLFTKTVHILRTGLRHLSGCCFVHSLCLCLSIAQSEKCGGVMVSVLMWHEPSLSLIWGYSTRNTPLGSLAKHPCIVDSEWPLGWDTLDSDYPWTWHTGSWLAADRVPSPSPIP